MRDDKGDSIALKRHQNGEKRLRDAVEVAGRRRLRENATENGRRNGRGGDPFPAKNVDNFVMFGDREYKVSLCGF